MARLDVIRGAENTIRDYRPKFVLEADENMARFGYTRTDLMGLIDSLGAYEYFEVTDSGLQPVSGKSGHVTSRDLAALPAASPH